ncbi:hypothetical protein KC711_07305 [Candidatus Peregrinibacteria bacterium]|nr:hypothetical protein [Candidatus Peregrinibacteria bacterium]
MENQKIDRFEFIEAFRMSIKPKHNKRQIEQLLYEYLSGKFDDPQSLSQYRTTKNKKWLKKNLTKEQQRVWLSSRRKEVDLNDSIDTAENAHLRIHNHQEVAISKIQAINML